MTDWKALCEELMGLWDAQPLPPYQPSWAGVIARLRASLAQPEPEVVWPTDEELLEINDGAYCPCTDEVNDEDDSSWQYTSDYIRWLDENGTPEEQGAYAAKGLRAVFNAGRRFGRQPAPPAEGEVWELVAALELEADAQDPATELQWTTHDQLRRAADLLKQCQAAPVPVASDIRYEFSVFDEDYTEQAGGSAPTYAQALSEGQHYLAQYQQDGPHTLEVRRVEVLPPGAFPVPDDAPVPLLPDGTQAIEPTEHTILVPARTPVPVSKRPWKREGWCDERGWCWFGWMAAPDHPPDSSWSLCKPSERDTATVSLPFHALPLPSGEVVA